MRPPKFILVCLVTLAVCFARIVWRSQWYTPDVFVGLWGAVLLTLVLRPLPEVRLRAGHLWSDREEASDFRLFCFVMLVLCLVAECVGAGLDSW